MAELDVPERELRRLVAGEAVTLLVPRGTLDEGDEITLHGEWTAVVEAVDPAATLGPVPGAGSTAGGRGDVVVLRVYGASGPVLGDAAFEAARRAVEGSMRW